MASHWLNKVTSLARHVHDSLGLKSKAPGSDVKTSQINQFRMMFCTDLYPESSEDCKQQFSIAFSPTKNDDASDDDDEGETASRKTKKISEAGQRTERFLTIVCEMLTNHVLSTFDPTQKVIDPDWLTGEGELSEKIEQMLQVSDDPQSLEEILFEMKEILQLSMKNGHPRVLNSATSGIDVMSLVGEWVTATANTNMFTYEIAPVFTLIEDIILTKMRSLVGWPDACGDGIFAPGAAISNMYALAVARHRLMPECKAKGMTQSSALVVFVTSQSGSSVMRAAVLLGLGLKNVVFVDCNARGHMMASDLDNKIKMAIKDGGLPFFVSATSGSAMLGSFDPLIEIAEVCDGHGLWLHVDVKKI